MYRSIAQTADSIAVKPVYKSFRNIM